MKTKITQRHSGRRHKSKAIEKKRCSQSQATKSLDLCTPCLAMQSAMQLLSRKIWEKVIEPKYAFSLLTEENRL